MKYVGITIILLGLAATAAQAQFLSDPTPVRTDTGSQITFTKELNGNPNYGTEGSADILYTNNTGVWTFSLSQTDLNRLSGIATFQSILALDDHYGVPVSNYAFTAAVNNVAVTPNTTTLAHGSPFNSIFTNWTPVTVPATSLVVGTNTLRLTNTSTTGANDWIAVDRITLFLPTASASAAPEPSVVALLTLPLLGIITCRRMHRQLRLRKNLL